MASSATSSRHLSKLKKIGENAAPWRLWVQFSLHCCLAPPPQLVGFLFVICSHWIAHSWDLIRKCELKSFENWLIETHSMHSFFVDISCFQRHFDVGQYCSQSNASLKLRENAVPSLFYRKCNVCCTESQPSKKCILTKEYVRGFMPDNDGNCLLNFYHLHIFVIALEQTIQFWLQLLSYCGTTGR